MLQITNVPFSGDGQKTPISRGINSADQIIININNIDKHIQRLF